MSNKGVIIFLFILSGFCGLVYQVVWSRMLTLVLGVTVYAVSMVLVTFMSGLSIGSFLFGRIIDKKYSPLIVYAFLEAGIGIYGLIFPVLFNYMKDFYFVSFPMLKVPWMSVSFRLILCFLLMLPPTILMGGTVPIISKFVVDRKSIIGRWVSILYSANTFGAVIGSFAAGFILIQTFGIKQTLYFSAFLNLFIAFTIFIYRNALKDEKVINSLGEDMTLIDNNVKMDSSATLLLIVLVVSGFSTFAYEVLWTRVLMMFLGHTVHAFAAVLTFFLLGITIGALFIGRIIDNRRNPVRLLGFLQISVGIIAIICIIVSKSVFAFIDADGFLGAYLNPTYKIISRFIISSLVMFPLTLLIGMVFPLATRAIVKHLKRIGKDVGMAYSINTIGAILGSLIAGFLIIPVLGVKRGIFFVALINVVIGGILATKEMPHRNRFKIGAVAFALCSSVLFGIGLLDKPMQILPRFFYNSGDFKVLYHEEDITGTVTVIEKSQSVATTYLVIDGIITMSSASPYEKRLCHLPLFIHPNPKKILIIGLGGGYTLEEALKYDVSEIDCVEISGGVVRALEYFPHENKYLLNDPRVNLIMDDGRHYLQVTREKYDIIISDVYLSILNGSSIFETKEFFFSVSRLLNENGIFAMTLGPIGKYLKSQLKTVLTEFPDVAIWHYDNESIVTLLACKNQWKIDRSLSSERIVKKNHKGGLKEIGLDTLESLITGFVMDTEAAINYVKGTRVSTDDHPYSDFMAIRIITLGETSSSKEIEEFLVKRCTEFL